LCAQSKPNAKRFISNLVESQAKEPPAFYVVRHFVEDLTLANHD